jgi:hypothetical protein
MIIGLDFDNTIVCYDRAIAQLSDEAFELPADVPRTKLGVRDYLRNAGREAEWTAFQGTIYGPGMRHAEPFTGAIETMQELQAQGHEVLIISHRSLRPYAGPSHDLHAAARNWVAQRLKPAGLFCKSDEAPQLVQFHETRQGKLEAIERAGCTAFLDDLSDVLNAPGFPAHAAKILFDPHREQPKRQGCHHLHTWRELPGVLAQLQ